MYIHLFSMMTFSQTDRPVFLLILFFEGSLNQSVVSVRGHLGLFYINNNYKILMKRELLIYRRAWRLVQENKKYHLNQDKQKN